MDDWRDAELAMSKARDERDAAITAARKAGVPLAKLSAASGLSPQRINDLAHGRRR